MKICLVFRGHSSSHIAQVEDPNTDVAIMGFNHSRLGAYDRFTRLNPAVIKDPELRHHIRNRSRMLFRALVDNDFTELLAVLEFAPVFIDLSCDQMINGRIWNEHYASALHASQFLELAAEHHSDKLFEGVIRRLRPLKHLTFDEAKSLLAELVSQVQKLHLIVKEHYENAFEQWIASEKLHPLQVIVLRKQIALLKESYV